MKKKDITVREAGKLGGLETKKLGKEHYQRAQLKSAEARKKKNRLNKKNAK